MKTLVFSLCIVKAKLTMPVAIFSEVFVIFLGKRILKAAGTAVIAAGAGVGAVAAAPFVLTAAGFTSAGKNTLFSFFLFFR